MEILKIDKDKPTKEAIDKIVSSLLAGKVLAYPADTVYALGCRADNLRAINRVYRIKGRTWQKKPLVLISSYAMLKKYFFVSKKQLDFLETIWPGPITVILKTRGFLPKKLNSEIGLSVRLPKSFFLTKIIKELGCPLISTSLNKSGEPVLGSVENLHEYLDKYKPDLALDAGFKKGKPSRLLDITDLNNIKILRK
jgi:L-threonylcarbamoyladenylate synthase